MHCVLLSHWNVYQENNAGLKERIFTDRLELLTTSVVCTNVNQLASVTADAKLLTGSRATSGRPAGF